METESQPVAAGEQVESTQGAVKSPLQPETPQNSTTEVTTPTEKASAATDPETASTAPSPVKVSAAIIGREIRCSDGVTFYNIKASKELEVFLSSRRYTEFIALYSALQPKFSQVANFAAPQKVLIGTNSESNLNFRTERFNEFLKIVTSIPELPSEAVKFLRLDDPNVSCVR